MISFINFFFFGGGELGEVIKSYFNSLELIRFKRHSFGILSVPRIWCRTGNETTWHRLR